MGHGHGHSLVFLDANKAPSTAVASGADLHCLWRWESRDLFSRERAKKGTQTEALRVCAFLVTEKESLRNGAVGGLALFRGEGKS